MPYAKVENHDECEAKAPWAVVKEGEEDEVLGCHETEEDADEQIAELEAEESEAEGKEAKPAGKPAFPPKAEAAATDVVTKDSRVVESKDDNAFEIPVMVVEGAWTGDKRYIDPGVLTWRDLPIPLMAITKTTMGHDDAEVSGKIEEIERRDANEDGLIDPRTQEAYADGTTYLKARGHFDTSEWAQEIERMVSEEFLRGVSVDMGEVTSDIVFLDKDGNEVEDVDFWDWLFGDEDGEMLDYDMGEKMHAGRVMGATVCPFPAFEGVYIEIPEPLVASGVLRTPTDVAQSEDERWPSIVNLDTPFRRPRPLVASAIPVDPPSKWFSDPGFTSKTPLTIERNGHIYGHLASWDECHTAFTGQCIMAPRSASDYAYYRVGAVMTDDEQVIPTGRITMGTGHAELWQNMEQARAHYDNTGTAVADVVCGEDEFGIWYSGALLPDVDEMAVRKLRGSALSGDWRYRGAQLELLAALAVNTPGLPIVRPQLRVASGMPQAMVAAGMVTERTIQKEMRHPSTSHRVVNEQYKDKVVRQALRDRVHHS
jgi:hypothetical protein